MSGGMPYGLQSMLKEGHKHMSGLEEAVLKNIEACKQLAQITRTSMGPNGECDHGRLEAANWASGRLRVQLVLRLAVSTPLCCALTPPLSVRRPPPSPQA